MNRLLVWLCTGSMALITACASQPGPRTPSDPIDSYDPEAVAAGAVRDFGNIYRQMGLVNSGPPVSFVASTASFATASPDTALVIVAMSIPNRGLAFERDGFQFKAVYQVGLALRKDSIEVRRISAGETVRVGSLKETTRTDESIIFTQVLRVPPGRYSLRYTVHDSVGGRDATQEAPLVVPRFEDHAMSTPVVVYEGAPRTRLDSVPQYLPQPRASVLFGSDSTVAVYLEAYGTSITTPVVLALSDAQHRVLWRDTAWLAQRNGFASSVVSVPLRQADVGVVTLSAVQRGGADTARTSVFVGFGADLPVLSFDEMIDYLRYFALPGRLQALRGAPAEARGSTWAAFLRQTDPNPETPQNEALLAYFARIRYANARFRSEASEGWLSDRGAAYVALGEPEQAYERQAYSNDVFVGQGGRVRLLIWEYPALQTRLVFYDETGGGQWRFTPGSASAFRALLSRQLVR